MAKILSSASSSLYSWQGTVVISFNLTQHVKLTWYQLVIFSIIVEHNFFFLNRQNDKFVFGAVASKIKRRLPSRRRFEGTKTSINYLQYIHCTTLNTNVQKYHSFLHEHQVYIYIWKWKIKIKITTESIFTWRH